MNITDLVIQVNKIVENHAHEVEEYFQNKNNSLEARWQLFTQSEKFLEIDYSIPYYLFIETLPTLSPHNNPLESGHYSYEDILYQLMDWGMDDVEPRIAEHIENEEQLRDELKEAILENGYFSIISDA